MMVVDTSAWIEFFKNGNQDVVEKVDDALQHDLIIMGDLIFCEIMQGIRSKKEQRRIASLFQSLPRRQMVGFHIAERSADHYRSLRARGITIRKTMDMLIGTFCAENGYTLIHYDKDFDRMARHIGLRLA